MSDLNAATSGCFPTTQWTQIFAVIQGDNEEASARALADFCAQYQPAVYNFFLRRGCRPECAQDYTQDFFLARILAPWEKRKSFLHEARRSEHGRFRSFLSWMLWNFLRDQIKAARTQRAGGKLTHIPLDEWIPVEESGEERAFASFGREFDRVFALEIIRKAAARSTHSTYLAAHLRGEISQPQAAEALGLTTAAFRQAYLRFRERLAESLREEVGKLAGPDEKDIKAEILYLMSLFEAPAP